MSAVVQHNSAATFITESHINTVHQTKPRLFKIYFHPTQKQFDTKKNIATGETSQAITPFHYTGILTHQGHISQVSANAH